MKLVLQDLFITHHKEKVSILYKILYILQYSFMCNTLTPNRVPNYEQNLVRFFFNSVDIWQYLIHHFEFFYF